MMIHIAFNMLRNSMPLWSLMISLEITLIHCMKIKEKTKILMILLKIQARNKRKTRKEIIVEIWIPKSSWIKQRLRTSNNGLKCIQSAILSTKMNFFQILIVNYGCRSSAHMTNTTTILWILFEPSHMYQIRI